MHTKVGLQIAQYAHWVCALLSSSLCHIMPYMYIVIFLEFCPHGFCRSVMIINRKRDNPANKPPPNAMRQKGRGEGVIIGFCDSTYILLYSALV